MWSHTVIQNIIKNPLYLGHTIMCKTESIFKLKTAKKTSEEERIRVDNTHEPLVSQEVFDVANAKIRSRKREDASGNTSVFSGLIKCGTCGKAMSQRYWTKKRHRIFVCTTYADNTSNCTDHRIFYEDLYAAVLSDIQRHAALAYSDREKAIQLAERLYAREHGNQSRTDSGRLKQAKKRLEEVTRLFDRLYEDSLSGRISKDNFTRLIDKYQQEQETLNVEISAIEATLSETKECKENAVKWADLMAQYVGIQELTAENLNLLVDRIEVFDRTDADGEVTQKVKVYYRFGGYISESCFCAKTLRQPKNERKERKIA